MAKILYTLIFSLITHNALAASCCGGGQSAASVMIADHIQEWTFSSMFRDDVGQTNNDGKALMDGEGNKDHTFTYAIEYKRLLSSRWQGNISTNFIQKDAERLGKNENNSGFGDLAIGGFFEALTNYNYIPLQPRIFTGVKAIIPFGENNFNSKKELRTDIRGTGFYKIDFPIVAAVQAWKFSATPQYLPKQKTLSSTYAFSTSGSYTYSISDQFDLSGTLQWSYLAKKRYKNTSLIPGQYWELSVSPAWIISQTNTLNLNYSDSTLIGKSRNSALYRSISLGMTWSELL